MPVLFCRNKGSGTEMVSPTRFSRRLLAPSRPTPMPTVTSGDTDARSKSRRLLAARSRARNVSNCGRADANASNSITAELSGGSKGTIGGDPSFKVVVTSGGSELSYR